MDLLEQKVGDLTTEIKGLKEFILEHYSIKEPPIKEVMNIEELIFYLKSRGVQASKSKIYKLSSGGGIPLKRINQRLLFFKSEIDIWCDEQIKAPKNNHNINNTHIIKSAFKKLNL